MIYHQPQGEGEFAYGRVVKDMIRTERKVVLKLRDGDQFVGILRREDQFTVTLDTGTRLILIFKNQIARIEPEPIQEKRHFPPMPDFG